ncbi:MAG: ATP-grasp domain-containing protein [Acidobacteria bacterium]|nr:ATP-grasp domain-containing protein [Acidobacteriota bacterium]
MRIGLTYNLKPPDAVGDEYEEFDSLETIEALEAALRANGHEPVRLGWGAELFDQLRSKVRIDGVLNIAEGTGGRGRESQVPALLEMLGIPCTGAPPLAIAITLDKALAKRLAQAQRIPTAPFAIDAAPSDRYPLFAKPAREGSSMGITSASLCRDERELRDTLERLKPYGPTLVEEYLPGDEYTVGMIDGEVLGVMQVVPRSGEKDFVYSLDVKRDYLRLVEYRLVDAEDAAQVARDVWRAFGLRDVARIDVRRDRDGVACFVEVNPLPGVHPVNSDLIIMGRLAGFTHEQVIGRVVAAAARRWGG